jgi:hypothetical protein
MSNGTGDTPNPRRQAAGRANRAKSGPLTEAGRERLRQAAQRNRPWAHSTGPRTEEGKARSARNGKVRQAGPLSVREARAELAAVRSLIGQMRRSEELCAGGPDG